MADASEHRRPRPAGLHTEALQLRYGARAICSDLDLSIPAQRFSVIVGPNGCGKSTLLRSLCRLLAAAGGRVLLDGRDIRERPVRDLARELGLLPQGALVPDGIRVAELVARGRYPHQTLLRQWSRADADAVAAAMAATDVAALADRRVDELSGGQRQRVWVALALAQETPLLLLDEPTTYLDLSHQIDLLELFRRLNREQGRTLVAVLHDLNQACRYADHLIALRDGRVVAEGPPARIVDAALVRAVFDLDCLVIDDPVSGTPLVIPRGRAR
ncbi:MAG TPA: ABC transporter ATP-binding protein [Tahibacter sp.]|uniref:ABC transporter ATP-binding protein n=1 Tax=Tahibacter sp. TaxID=2056211 RepID=UPI002BEAE2B4|nr:ABC transporter ATP-binding protein [Tahibacter sp.]HSX61726.1 ABC transporter ATP-binding protein [Tahibacter sp.]